MKHILITILPLTLSSCFTGARKGLFSPRKEAFPINDANVTIMDPMNIPEVMEQSHFNPFMAIIIAVLCIGIVPVLYNKLQPKASKLWVNIKVGTVNLFRKIKKRIDERKK